MRTLGIAIVGTGMIGAVHRRAALLAGATVRGVAASSPQRAREVAQSWNVPRAYRDIDEVLADPQVQVVHVCTPNHLHRSMAQAALEAGKHVICEKPLATTLQDAQALAALAAATGLVATVPGVRAFPTMPQGLGGRFDSVNAFDADCVVITSIGHLILATSAVMSEKLIVAANPASLAITVRAMYLIHHSTPAGGNWLPSRALMLRRAQCAEVVGVAAYRDHQRVVRQGARRQQLTAVFIQGGGQLDLLGRPLQAAHAPQLELEVVPLGLGHVVELVFGGIERTGRHFVQQRLPDVRQVGVDQGDVGVLALAQAFTQAGRQFQAAGAAADNHDAMSHGDIS